MLPNYPDIRSLTDKEPLWFDSNGVPRYAPFTPELLGVYARFAILVEIQCQACDARILVGDHWSHVEMGDVTNPYVNTWQTVLPNQQYHYGDPPWHQCPGAGESMNSIPLSVVEAWERESWDWTRVPAYEQPIKSWWGTGG